MSAVLSLQGAGDSQASWIVEHVDTRACTPCLPGGLLLQRGGRRFACSLLSWHKTQRVKTVALKNIISQVLSLLPPGLPFLCAAAMPDLAKRGRTPLVIGL